jgi:hypothetical protein
LLELKKPPLYRVFLNNIYILKLILQKISSGDIFSIGTPRRGAAGRERVKA